jgi:FKBP-type peptidyl-prolyl cis-trans isomerase
VKFDKMAEKNLEESTEYFARNKQNTGVVFLGNGLQYKVLRKGHGKKPIIGDKVKVHYKGTFLNGVEFDNTYSTGVSEFVLTLQVLPGIVEGLKLMSEGSKWQLFVPPHLGYGKKGQRYVDKEHLSIEPNTTLLFEIELVEVVGEHLISGDRQTNNK